MLCAYCEQTLTCDACRAEYQPPDPEAYAAISRPEVAIACPDCGAPLVCHWCHTPYDGEAEPDGEATPD